MSGVKLPKINTTRSAKPRDEPLTKKEPLTKISIYHPMDDNLVNNAIEAATKNKKLREQKKESTHLPPLFEKVTQKFQKSPKLHSVANELSDFNDDSEPIPRRLPPISRGRTPTRSPRQQSGGKRNRKSRSNRVRKNRTSKK